MSQLKNNRLFKAIWREPADVTPIWIMRQAGRYLPEYRKTRERAGSFMALCQTPELACEVTLQPLQRYDLDAAILFSDILTIPDAMGLGLQFIEGQGPLFTAPLTTPDDIKQLAVPDLEKLKYVYDAIQLIRHELAERVPLIGFCGSPFTLAAYMLEGKSQPGFPRVMQMINHDPFLLHHLLDILAQAVAAHLNAQIAAGAQAIMLFDTWGGLLTPENYAEFSLYYIQQIAAQLTRHHQQQKIPFILFTKGSKPFLKQMSQVNCDVLGVDFEMTLNEARATVGDKMALQGNLNPAILLQTPDIIRREVLRVLDSFGHGSGHIFNLGHGITPDVPPENVKVLVDAVHELSKPYHVMENKNA